MDYKILMLLFISIGMGAPEEAQTAPEYCLNGDGRNYIGKVSTTEEGLECQAFTSQSPHDHTYTSPTDFPDAEVPGAYCRNARGEVSRPWCYTTDPEIRWQYCDIPSCEDCAGGDGTNYVGTLSTTVGGLTCQAWTSQSPHTHEYTSATAYPDDEVPGGYCRNVGPSLRPWCYTTDPDIRWEVCDIPCCEGSPCIDDCPSPNDCTVCKVTKFGYEYKGTLSVTSSGLTCQRWDAQSPRTHEQKYDMLFPDDSVSDANNYCRNPDAHGEGPWCYTTDSDITRESCGVPDC